MSATEFEEQYGTADSLPEKPWMDLGEDGMDSPRHLVLNRDEFLRRTHPEGIDAREPSWEDRQRFEDELHDPLVITDPSGERFDYYRIYGFNRDRYDPDNTVLVLFPPLGSSPSTVQGHEMAWQFSQRYPDHFVIALANEGTPDARVKHSWFQRKDVGLEEIAHMRLECIERIKHANGFTDPANMTFIAQSFGCTVANRVAEEISTYKDMDNSDQIEEMILLSPPVSGSYSAEIAARMIVQEVFHVFKSMDPQEAASLIRHGDILPLGFHRSAVYHKLLSIIPRSRLEVEHMDPGIPASICNGENDWISRSSVPESEQNADNITRITLEGDAHSSPLIDAEFCGRLCETIMREWSPRIRKHGLSGQNGAGYSTDCLTSSM